MKLRHRPRAAAGALALLFLAACAPERAEETQAASGPAASPSPPLPTQAAVAAAPKSPPRSRRRLAVEAEGLRLFAGESARLLSFGMPLEQLLALLERFRGPADRGTHGECGPGPLEYAVWADGLTLYFQDGRFAGWALDERAAGAHATVGGLAPGSTRRALETAYEAKIEQTSLGTEFRAGGLYGVLDAPGPNGRVTALWAGVSCVFR